MNKKSFYKKIRNTIKEEQDITNINIFDKLKLHMFLRSLQYKFIESINYKNYHKDELTINIDLTKEEFDNLFGEEFEKNKIMSYFRHICELKGINLNYNCNESKKNDAYFSIIATVSDFKNDKKLLKKINQA